MRPNAISAGDVVRAFRLLDARNEETRAAIARVLGFELRSEAPAATMGGRRRRKHEASAAPDPGEALFNPQWTRAIISTMARIRTRDGPPEIESLVAAAAERQPMLSLALTVSETASGADVLMDVGEHMAAFLPEQMRLVDMMRRVLGRGMVSVVRFNGSRPGGVFESYRPARPGWPVIVLTDLGIGGGATAVPLSEWLAFSRLVRAAGCHLVALVPYPRAQWPADLSSLMHIIHWDRATTVGSIRSALRSFEGH
jgi:hypothetical protein